MKYLLSSILFLTAFSCYSQVDTPPPPAAPDEVFKVVEEMPRFPGCENLKMKNKVLIECSKGKMLEYIHENLVYPPTAEKKRIEGMSVVQFNINKDGTLEEIRVVRDPGSGTGEAAAAVINKMNADGIKWVPGKQRDRTVVVQYILPIRFALRNR